MVRGNDLGKFKRVIVDQFLCIECHACVVVCPFEAWELDEDNKARLIWDKCQDDFSCITSCPVSCIWRPEDAPPETKAKSGWLRFSRVLESGELEIFEAWSRKYGLAVKAVNKC